MNGSLLGLLCLSLTPFGQPDVRLLENRIHGDFLKESQGYAHFPRGIVRLQEPLVVDLSELGRIQLVGQGTKFIMEAPGPAIRVVGSFKRGNADPKNVPDVVKKYEMNCSISGIDIVGGHPMAMGIELEGTMGLSIKGVSIRKCKHAIHLVKLNRNLSISDCNIYDNTGIGVFYDNTDLHQSNITGCHISYCSGGGIVSRGGEVRNLQIGNCDIEANVDTSTKSTPTANIELDSTKGSVAEVAITGCTIQHSKAPGSANIRVKGKGDGGKLGPTREGHITITGNVLSDVEYNIDLSDCRGVTITGNTFWMAYANNLRAERCSHIAMGANAMERNPRYDYGTSKETSNSVSFKNCDNCNIQGLQLHNANKAKAGLTLEDCQDFTISGCSFVDCDPAALALIRVRDTLITGCRGKGPKAEPSPVIITDCANLTFSGNTLAVDQAAASRTTKP